MRAQSQSGEHSSSKTEEKEEREGDRKTKLLGRLSKKAVKGLNPRSMNLIVDLLASFPFKTILF